MKWLTLSPSAAPYLVRLISFLFWENRGKGWRSSSCFWACVRISLSVSRRRGNWLPPFILLFKWEEKDFHALWSEFNGSQIIHFWASSLASFRSLAFISVSFSGRVYLAPIGTPWSDGAMKEAHLEGAISSKSSVSEWSHPVHESILSAAQPA